MAQFYTQFTVWEQPLKIDCKNQANLTPCSILKSCSFYVSSERSSFMPVCMTPLSTYIPFQGCCYFILENGTLLRTHKTYKINPLKLFCVLTVKLKSKALVFEKGRQKNVFKTKIKLIQWRPKNPRNFIRICVNLCHIFSPLITTTDTITKRVFCRNIRALENEGQRKRCI